MKQDTLHRGQRARPVLLAIVGIVLLLVTTGVVVAAERPWRKLPSVPGKTASEARRAYQLFAADR